MSATQTEKVKAKGKPSAIVAAPTALATRAPVDLKKWGRPDLTTQDIMIPKILAMQGMSKKVLAGEAKFGEFRDSLNDVVLGDEKNPMEFVPFFSEKVYVVMRQAKGAKQFKFHHQEPITRANESHEYLCALPDGGEEKWYRTMNFYVLLPSQIAEGKELPHLLSFRSSSFKGGSRLMTRMWVQNPQEGMSPAGMVIQLSCEKKTNDQGTFVVMDVKAIRKATEEEEAVAEKWNTTVQSGAVKVDHSDLVEESSGAAPAAPESTEF